MSSVTKVTNEFRTRYYSVTTIQKLYRHNKRWIFLKLNKNLEYRLKQLGGNIKHHIVLFVWILPSMFRIANDQSIISICAYYADWVSIALIYKHYKQRWDADKSSWWVSNRTKCASWIPQLGNTYLFLRTIAFITCEGENPFATISFSIKGEMTSDNYSITT